jgi:hypothetical protein
VLLWRTAATGTTTALLMVRSCSCTLTNWLGNSCSRALLKRALAFTVPVVVSIWLSSEANTPCPAGGAGAVEGLHFHEGAALCCSQLACPAAPRTRRRSASAW